MNPFQECVEEICNYEEAREVFETNVQGLTEWWENEHPSNASKKDSNTGIIVGVVIGVVVLIIIIVIIIGLTFISSSNFKNRKINCPKKYFSIVEYDT